MSGKSRSGRGEVVDVEWEIVRELTHAESHRKVMGAASGGCCGPLQLSRQSLGARVPAQRRRCMTVIGSSVDSTTLSSIIARRQIWLANVNRDAGDAVKP